MTTPIEAKTPGNGPEPFLIDGMNAAQQYAEQLRFKQYKEDRIEMGPAKQPVYELKPDGTLQWNFHWGQSQVMNCPKRFVIALAGRQGGKCLSPSSKVLLSTGERRRIGDMRVGDEVLCLDESSQKIIKSKVTLTHDSGVQRVIRVTTRSGREIEATPWHPMYSPEGWQRADEFDIGDFVAVPRHLPVHGVTEDSTANCRLLGYLLGDGGTTRGTITFSNIEQSVIDDFTASLPEGYEIADGGRPADWYIRRTTKGDGKGDLRHKIKEWDIKCLAKHKRVPAVVFESTQASIAHVLGALFSCDGWIDEKGFGIGLASKGMIQDIQHLLLRFGILSRTRYKSVKLNGKEFDSWDLVVRDYDSLLKLAAAVWMPNKSAKLDSLIQKKSKMRPNGKDLVPDFPIKECSGHSRPRCTSASRDKAQKMFNKFGCGEVQAFSDIYWDQVESIEELEEQQTYDITVEGTHNFIAEDIFAHNTEVGAPWLLQEMMARGPGLYMVVAPSFPLLQDSALPKFRNLFENMLNLGKYVGDPSPRFTLSKEGEKFLFGKVQDKPTIVRFCHAQNARSLEAKTALACWIDEGGQDDFTIQAWEAIEGRLTTTRGRCLITTTPYNLGFLKQTFFDPWIEAKKDHEHIEIITFDSTLNPAFPREEFERLEKRMPGWRFRMFYKGEFAVPSGLVYSVIQDVEAHAKLPRRIPYCPIPDYFPRYGGVDFGGVNTCGILAAQTTHEWNGLAANTLILYRIYKPGHARRIHEHAAGLLEGETFVDRWIGGAGSEGQWRDEFWDEGVPIEKPPITDVNVGIQRVYNLLAAGRLCAFGDLTDLWDELYSYRYETDPGTGEITAAQKIVNQNDYHVMDAVRYLCSIFSEMAGDNSPRATAFQDSGHESLSGMERQIQQRSTGRTIAVEALSMDGIPQSRGGHLPSRIKQFTSFLIGR